LLGVDKERVAPRSGNIGRVVTPIEGDWSARPTEKLGNRALSGAYLSEADLVLALGVIILRASKDHEAAIRVGEGVPVLERRPLVLERLLIAVPTLALPRLTHNPLEEFAILKLVLDGVAVAGARFLQELLQVVVVALSLTHSVGRCDCVGVRVMSIPPLPLVLCRGGALFLLHMFGLSHGPAID
jgi:hypothetical protein